VTSNHPSSTPVATAFATVVWTTLPQGFVPGSSTTVQVSVMASPMLSIFNRVTKSTSGELSAFADWVNWPATLRRGIGMGFEFIVDGESVIFPAMKPDVTVLNGDFWTAIFDPDNTIVESFVGQDFSQITPTTFRAQPLHSFVQNVVYAPLGAATVNKASHATLSIEGLSGGSVATGSTAAGGVFSALQGNTAQIGQVVDFHSPLVPLVGGTTPPPIPTPALLDFHQGIAALGHYPELLPYLGLVFTMEVELPDGSPTAMSAIPSWNPTDPTTTTDVSLPTLLGYGGPAGFFAKPLGNDYCHPTSDVQGPAGVTPTGGFLNLDNTPYGPVPPAALCSPAAIIDYDVDAACENLNSYTLNIQSLAEAHASTPGVSLDMTLPSLRSVGPTLYWDDWGGPVTSVTEGSPYFPGTEADPVSRLGGSFNLITLAARQTLIQANIQAYLADPDNTTLQPLYMEDVTRGWRVDVLNLDDPDGFWQSLHWQTGTYTFGDEGLQIQSAQPVEGILVPGVTSAPVEAPAVPPFLVHEAFGRWDGWGMAAPRPFKIVDGSGNVSLPPGNPASTATDSAGHTNPQLSAEFVVASAGIGVGDGYGGYAGFTGLPPLRFGRNYQYRARAVDLSGWSLPQLTPSQGSLQRTQGESPEIAHTRWEPIQPPLVLPVAPLTAGEGVLTIVLRDDGQHPASANARWLFPPKVHEQLAEQHGVFDATDTSNPAEALPDPNQFALINKYADGDIASLPGVVLDSSGTLILPLAAGGSAPATPVNWLPDPACYGLTITGFGQDAAGLQLSDFDYSPVIPAAVVQAEGVGPTSPHFFDTWIPQGGAAWPALEGKLLRVVPVAGPSASAVIQAALPGWEVTPATASTSDILTMSVVPGSVYVLEINSIPPQAYEKAFGLAPWIAGAPNLISDIDPAFEFLIGNMTQITPTLTLRVVYATLLPALKPAFSAAALAPVAPLSPGIVAAFSSGPNDTSVTIDDSAFNVDPATTSTVTWTATWVDPVDTTLNPAPDTDTIRITQDSLTTTVELVPLPGSSDLGPPFFPYPPAAAADPLVPAIPPPSQVPFGTIGMVPTETSGPTYLASPELAAVHRIGDTKHHLVDYMATGTSRFGHFFATTTTVKFTATGSSPPEVVPVSLDSNGVDVNLVKVVLPADKNGPAVTVPDYLYTVDGPNGTITLTSVDASVQQPSTLPTLRGTGRVYTTVPLLHTPLQVSYVPTDTLAGPTQPVHVLNTAVPPPLKVVKVAPAWSTSTSHTVGDRTIYTRAGNSLRVYMERPWYTTGCDELLGVISQPISEPTVPTLPTGTGGFTDYSLLGLDPISVSSHAADVPYTQTQLGFVTTVEVPNVNTYQSGSEPGHPASVMTDEFGTLCVWSYQPEFDSVTNLWYADVQLDLAEPPPPGYFVRLSLVRFQPYSNGGGDNPLNFLSPVTLVTFAQPVADRTVVVTQLTRDSLNITVTGPAYYGWRPVANGMTFDPNGNTVYDIDNPYAAHPNSAVPPGLRGSNETSTMIVEVQHSDTSTGLSGDFAWTTVPGLTYRLGPTFPAESGGGGDPIVEWTKAGTLGRGGIDLPTDLGPLRLRISELDYYPYATEGLPKAINTEQRRPFVAFIPVG
jgi:hypothetical protein